MRIGTRSLLFGCHQFVLHPLFVLCAWWLLYGRPTWREVVAIVIHDWGYVGARTMEGPDGDRHPLAPARWLDALGWDYECCLVLYHSRFYAKRAGCKPSPLCWADKLGTALMPWWLWAAQGALSGELREYLAHTGFEIHGTGNTRRFFLRYRGFVTHLLDDVAPTARPRLWHDWTMIPFEGRRAA